MDASERKVTFIITALEGGGAEAVCVNVANGLAERGWDVTLVILHLGNAAYVDRISDRVNFQVLGAAYVRHAFFLLLGYIRKHKVRKVVVFTYQLAVMMVLVRAVSFQRFKLVARNINTLSEVRARAKGWWRNLVARLIDAFYCKVDYIINQCKDMQRDLVDLYGVNPERAPVIYNSVNQRIEQYAAALDWEAIEKKNYYLCVGRLDEQKAFHYAIEAFSKVADESPGLRLKIVGQGRLETQLRETAEALGVASRVDFEKFQKDIIPFYLGAKATLLTSLYEGFPNVLIESITLGTPVIAFDCKSGPREIVDDRNGYLVEHLSVEGLVAAMRNVDGRFDPATVHESSAPYATKYALDAYENLLLKPCIA
ncbi:glycosyltransferase [Billgrantia sp. C5P2]|uniref:glycosyltransferase n=1 Tax=Billgrantia sp. C5P2 TaxID=3436239 RepID=UPI003DA60306